MLFSWFRKALHRTPPRRSTRLQLEALEDRSVPAALSYSTFLGGAGADQANGIAADAAGATYLVGTTSSSDFPTVGASRASLGGTQDAFVTKLNPDGTLAWSTYLGGSGTDSGSAIAVDGNGNVYVTGTTASSDFPTKHAFQGSLTSGQSA